jgi:cell division protein FtsL
MSGQASRNGENSGPAGNRPPHGAKKTRIATEASSGVRLGAYSVLLMVFFIELFVFAWARVQSVRIGYQMTDAFKEREVLRERQLALRAEWVHLKSPERISRIAEQRLGLSMPAVKQVVVVPYEKKR